MNSSWLKKNGVVIVTGISQGLGEALVSSALENNFAVIGLGRRPNPKLVGDFFHFTQADLSKIADTEKTLSIVFNEICELQIPYVCLINSAAIGHPLGLQGTLQTAAIAEAINVNLTSMIVACNLFCQRFSQAPHTKARILNISSGAAQNPFEGNSVYSVAKAGVEMLTRAIALEHETDSFKCIGLRPGVIDSPMQEHMRNQEVEVLPCVSMFKEFHSKGSLKSPSSVAKSIIEKLVIPTVESGRIYRVADLLDHDYEPM